MSLPHTQGIHSFFFVYGEHNLDDGRVVIPFTFDPARTDPSHLNLVALVLNETHATVMLQVSQPWAMQGQFLELLPLRFDELDLTFWQTPAGWGRIPSSGPRQRPSVYARCQRSAAEVWHYSFRVRGRIRGAWRRRASSGRL